MRNLISAKICFVVCYKKKKKNKHITEQRDHRNNKRKSKNDRKQKRESKYSEAIGDVNVESLTSLSVSQVRWLKPGKECWHDRKSHYNSIRLFRKFYGRKRGITGYI